MKRPAHVWPQSGSGLLCAHRLISTRVSFFKRNALVHCCWLKMDVCDTFTQIQVHIHIHVHIQMYIIHVSTVHMSGGKERRRSGEIINQSMPSATRRGDDELVELVAHHLRGESLLQHMQPPRVRRQPQQRPGIQPARDHHSPARVAWRRRPAASSAETLPYCRSHAQCLLWIARPRSPPLRRGHTPATLLR